MGKKSFYFPRMGQGAQMKLVINMIMGTMMTAFALGAKCVSLVGSEFVVARPSLDNRVASAAVPRQKVPFWKKERRDGSRNRRSCCPCMAILA